MELSMLLALGVIAAVSGVGAWLVNLSLLNFSSGVFGVDQPNARSLHEQPTPRGGGLGIVAMLLLIAAPSMAWLGGHQLLAALLPPIIAIALVSYADDRFSLPAWPRLFVHVLAAVWFVLNTGAMKQFAVPGEGFIFPELLATPFTVALIVWLTNLYNFMDGIDGLAGGMAIFGFGAIGLLAAGGSDWPGAALAVAVAGSAGGFLVLNFPPARLFMGDVGSSVLGFLAGAFIVRTQTTGTAPVWIGLLIFAPFVVDATVTIARRALTGERIWEAHRTHFYQRWAALSEGHKPTVLIEYALMFACAASALVMIRSETAFQWIGLVAWCGVFLALMIGVSLRERVARQTAPERIGK